ncbi:adhesion G protein-coupled receptor E2-like isoform X1 [Montipora capricornis]|uniref:adhesion G protein-coupled receptor E2-like isoform X1 n=1 Tax=Montipora capricornis TaxID=246305 RepID=UPI0035F1FEB4
MLQGHIYQTMSANIGLHCLSACLKDDRCQSFNFVMSLQMCEFSDRTKEARPEDFIPDADRYYFRKYIKRAQLGSISELAAESCKEIKMSEGRAPNGKYWMSSIKPGIPVLAFCDMNTEDVDECTASSPVCHENAACNNTLGSYQCTCKRGFAGDGKICRDVDECTASSPVCHVNATCNNAIGSYQCTCRPGYAGDGKTCRDFNECSSSPSPCHVNAKCQNTEGSYVCLCEAGYTGNGKTCTDIDECNASPSPCHAKAKCKNNQGSYLCSCEAGYTGDGKTCTDFNECSSSPSPCHVNAKCQNTEGSYLCLCEAGYTGNGKTCTDIDECNASPSPCHAKAKCKNNQGSYLCSCEAGYTGDGKTCTVIPRSCEGILKTNSKATDGIYAISTGSSTFQLYCDMTTSGQAWTLTARFSSNDSKNWMIDSGKWWYDKNVEFGETANPSSNTDMISQAFWLVSGQEFKITRSDDPQHTALLQTTGDCLGGQTFRTKMTSYGDFRNGRVWASDRCLGNCRIQYGGQYNTTDGFQQATCNGNIQNATQIGFWCDWNGGDGAVLMIGGGGLTCNRADHGIGITEANQASFVKTFPKHDFGNDANHAPAKSYSLNLWLH